MSWIRARASFALLRPALLSMRGWRATRKIHLELSDIDFDIEKGHANISLKTLRMIFYFLVFITFLGKFPYLKSISYILLSYIFRDRSGHTITIFTMWVGLLKFFQKIFREKSSGATEFLIFLPHAYKIYM